MENLCLVVLEGVVDEEERQSICVRGLARGHLRYEAVCDGVRCLGYKV